MKNMTRLLITLLAAGALVACGGGEDENQNQNQPQENHNQEELVDLIATAEAAGDFTTLLAALDAAELTGALQGEDDFTVFAPTDSAFDALPEGTLDSLLEPANQETLSEILLFHVVAGTVLAEDVELGEVETLAGLDAEITSEGGNLFYAGAQITVTDVMASNGVIHVLDAVALPPEDENGDGDNDGDPEDPTIVDLVADNDDFSTLVAALTQAGLVDTLSGDGPFTVFAPTNQAFEGAGIDLDSIDDDVLIDVLTYHVLDGDIRAADLSPGIVTALNGALALIEEGPTYAGATSADTDIVGSNGVIHVIDEVVMPADDIVQVATDNGFDTLVTAVTEAGLADALRDDGPFTVFAPTDDAFDDLPEGALDDLLADTDALQQVLLYHALEGAISSYDVQPGSFTTASGINVEIADDGGLTYGGATISVTNVMARNSVIHVIDSVVLPPTIVDLAVATDDFSTLVAALTQADLVDVLIGDGPFTVFAPTNQAFADAGIDLDTIDADLLVDVLTYHVLEGQVMAAEVSPGLVQALNGALALIEDDGAELFYAGAEITGTDILGTNGVIHVIDEVVMPADDIVDTAIGVEDEFDTLVDAVIAAELVDTLRGEGPFTVFAPTDAAFDALPAGALDDLLADQDALANVLLFHVLPQAVLAADVTPGFVTTATADGLDAEITASGGSLFYEGAEIVITDVIARNGVIHVIDAVVLPPED